MRRGLKTWLKWCPVDLLVTIDVAFLVSDKTNLIFVFVCFVHYGVHFIGILDFEVPYQRTKRCAIRADVGFRIVASNVGPPRNCRISVVSQVVDRTIFVADEAIPVVIFVHIDAKRLRVSNSCVERSTEKIVTLFRVILTAQRAVLLTARTFPQLYPSFLLSVIITYDAVYVVVAIKICTERGRIHFLGVEHLANVFHVVRIEDVIVCRRRIPDKVDLSIHGSIQTAKNTLPLEC